MKELGTDLGALTSSMVTRAMHEDVPFYAGITLDDIGGRGLRWQEREQAAAHPAGEQGPFTLADPPAAAPANGRLRLGSFRSIWASPEVGVAPALKFLHPRQRVELPSPTRSASASGRATASASARTARASAASCTCARPRSPGSVFLETAIGADSASALEGPLVEVSKA